MRGLAPVKLVTLSWSSSVLETLLRAAGSVRALHVLVSEPGGEGRRLADAVRAAKQLGVDSDEAIEVFRDLLENDDKDD